MFAIAPFHMTAQFGQRVEAFLEQDRIVIADGIDKDCFRHISMGRQEMVKALAPFGVGWGFKRRQELVELHSDELRVDQLVLCPSGMEIFPADMDGGF